MRLAIFDLDNTIWHPEMCDLSEAPKLEPASSELAQVALKEGRTNKDGHVLSIGENACMLLHDGASFALSDINRLKRDGHRLQAAAASTSDEPSWARICLNHLVIEDGMLLKECFTEERTEIYDGSKVNHIRSLQQKTGIAYCDMVLFDDEYQKNIVPVSKGLPEVKVCHTPDGMTKEAWEQAKALFGIT